MRYEMMRPGQIREAIDKGLPLLMPLGVLEYHGPQNPIGTDALIAQGIVHRVEERVECVVAPTFFYGYTGFWAAGPELGELSIDGDGLYRVAKSILKGFLDAGWRKIYVVCHHQGPQGVTMLSFQRAVTELGFENAIGRTGTGWRFSSEYEELSRKAFYTMKVVGAEDFSTRGYGGHGNRDETMAMMALYPGTVDLAEMSSGMPVFELEAEPTAELGNEVADAVVESWVKELSR